MTEPTPFQSQAFTAMELLNKSGSLRHRLGHAEIVRRWMFWRDVANCLQTRGASDPYSRKWQEEYHAD
jgi:hypothetical protein